MGKLTLLTVGAAAYLLGSRAGREPYEKFSAKAESLFNDSRVQDVVGQAKATASKKADEATERVTDAMDDGDSAHDPLVVPR